jgi:acyl-coenzyme A thioesterase PaaI-like protein
VTENHQGAPGLAHGGLLSLAFDEALGKLMWLLRAPAVTARLETDFVKPVPMGTTLHIRCRRLLVRFHARCTALQWDASGDENGDIAVKASALFVIVPMSHFLDNAPAEYLAHIKAHPELLAFVDPDFEIAP